jgi:hypothetical protein
MADIKLSALTSRVAFVDPAAGKTRLKKQSARSAIACVAADGLDRIFVLDAWADRCSTEKLIDRMCWTHTTFGPSIIGVEANAMQEIFSDAVMLLLKSRGIVLPIVPVGQPVGIDKDLRIRLILQPIVGFGRLFLAEGQVELEKEITAFPSGKMKDMVDSLASACKLLPARTQAKQRSDKYEALAAYHRQVGTPPEQIERRLQEVMGAEGQRPVHRERTRLAVGNW